MPHDQKKVAHIKLIASKTSILSLEQHCAGTATSRLPDLSVGEVRHTDCDRTEWPSKSAKW